MAIQANHQPVTQESWSSYIWRAVKQATPAALLGFSISANPIGASISAGTALALFFATENRIVRDSNLLKVVKHSSYMLIPAAVARNLPGTPDCLASKVPVGERDCLGVDSLSAVSSYVAFKSIDELVNCNEAVKYVLATTASVVSLAYSRFLELLVYETNMTGIACKVVGDGEIDMSQCAIIVTRGTRSS